MATSSQSTARLSEGLLTLIINSADRINTNINNGFYQLPRTYTNVSTLELVQFNMLNSIYAFSNSVFPLLDGSGQYWIAITDGTYVNADQFAAQLQIDINSTAGILQTYAVTFDPITLTLTISASGNFSIDWHTAAGTNPAGTFPANYQLGFGSVYPTTDYGPATSITTPYAIHIVNTDNIGIILNIFAQDGNSTNNATYTFAIPNSVPYGSELFYTRGVREDQTLVFDAPQNLSSLTIGLTNLTTGALLDTHGSEFTMKIKMSLLPYAQSLNNAINRNFC